MATLNTRLRRDERGQAVVELALTLPLLLLIVMGMFDFGVMFQRYEIVTNAAREGARVGVLTGAGYSDRTRNSVPLQYLAVGGLNVRPRAAASLTPGTRCAEATTSTVTITGSSPAKTVQSGDRHR